MMHGCREQLREALGPDQARELIAAMPAPEPAAAEGLAAAANDRPAAHDTAVGAAPEAAPQQAASDPVRASASLAKQPPGAAHFSQCSCILPCLKRSRDVGWWGTLLMAA